MRPVAELRRPSSSWQGWPPIAAISEWRAACNALRMLGQSFLASRRTCPRLSRITLAASLLAAIPIVTLAQNGTGRAGVDFAAYVGADRIETVVAFTDAALLPVAGLSTPLRVTGGDGARVAYELVNLRPGFALIALSAEREQHFRICGASGCRQYRVVRGD
jgi:hypothetical protein